LKQFQYRIRPTTSAHAAWDHSAQRTIKLFPQYAKSTATTPPEFHFDEVITGSENRPVYNAVARSHVCAAMDGYNSIVFAYGQTASGKTFTLVRPCLTSTSEMFSLFHLVWKRRSTRHNTACNEGCVCLHPPHTHS
jgi:hypothetical protein